MKKGEYVIFCVEFKCNSDCPICSIDNMRSDSKPISLSVFKSVLERCIGKYSGIILSGGEVTLNKQLPEFIVYARSKGFRNIMIQTNGRILSDMRKAEELKRFGANQFFVSFHSADKGISEKMAERTGSYAQTVKGLENLDALKVEVITNTVLTSMNYEGLPDTARFLAKFSNIKEMHFWGFVPLSAESAQLMLPYVAAAPYLNQSIKYLESCGKKICVKYFPACLLEDPYKALIDNSQSKVLGMRDDFWKKWDACDFRRHKCCEGTDCMGLPMIHKDKITPEDWVPLNLLEDFSRE